FQRHGREDCIVNMVWCRNQGGLFTEKRIKAFDELPGEGRVSSELREGQRTIPRTHLRIDDGRRRGGAVKIDIVALKIALSHALSNFLRRRPRRPAGELLHRRFVGSFAFATMWRLGQSSD